MPGSGVPGGPGTEGSSGGRDRRPSDAEIERRLKKMRAEIERTAPLSDPAAAQRSRSGTGGTRRGRIMSIAAALVVVALLAGGAYELPRLGQHRTSAPADNNPVTNGATPTARPATTGAVLPTPTLAAPFLGTPAQSYADGAAGIVIPPAAPVGTYTAAQVEAAYQMTKTMLVAADLNGPTLAGGAPDAFANLLIPQQRSEFVAGLDRTGVNAHGDERSTRAWITSFAPGTTQLVGSVVKVHGTMQATTGMNGSWHVLVIHADYLFVYPVEEPGVPSTLMRIVARQVVGVDFAAYTDPGGALEPWWEGEGGGDAGARCDVHDGFVHPQFPSGPPDKVKPTGTPVNPYDQSTAPANVACQATTGT
jgi:hypothetical protein